MAALSFSHKHTSTKTKLHKQYDLLNTINIYIIYKPLSSVPYICVCNSYKEYRRFKKSTTKAAVAIADLARSGVSSAPDGLVQGVVDTFDADMSSQNGNQSTHSLAVLLTQYSTQTHISP